MGVGVGVKPGGGVGYLKAEGEASVGPLLDDVHPRGKIWRLTGSYPFEESIDPLFIPEPTLREAPESAVVCGGTEDLGTGMGRPRAEGLRGPALLSIFSFKCEPTN